MKSKILAILAVGVVVIALGIAGFSFATAQASDSPLARFAPALGESVQPFFHGRGPGRPGPGGDFDGPLSEYVQQATADILGLSVDELQAAREAGTPMSELLENAGLTAEEFRTALEAAMPELLAQAVADGELTQEQADRIAEGFPVWKTHRFGAEMPLVDYLKEAAADILGISVDELEAARSEGVSHQELLDNAGLTAEEFKAEMEAALPDIVAQAVADGAITAEQGDQILENGLNLHCRRHRGPRPGGFGPGPGNGPGSDTPSEDA